MSGTWDTTTELGGMNLLPEGTREYRITNAKVELVTRGQGNPFRELVVSLSCTEGSGDANVPLEPFIHTPDGQQLWERIFKGAAAGLGFQPTAGHLPMRDVADEFARWIPQSGLVGQSVEVAVEHVASTKLKDDGTPFINHRVKFRGLTGGSSVNGAPAAQVPAFSGAGAADTEDPWA